ncbi:MAG: glycosyltransferase family 2 protein [Bdellovibrio sp.]|nr:glycosyltransferase family 2 protein [Methylotenera sp.]
MTARQKLSVTIITKNEEAAIAACLASVAWADEIVVVDSGSTDKTVDICKAHGAIVHNSTQWPGFGPQKNIALGFASHDWVLSIDADERVSPELRAEIEQALSLNAKNVAYQIPRSSSYCGQFMRHSGWWPDYVLRLFPNALGKFSDDIVHEHVIFNGEIKTLKNPILHISYTDLEEVLDKTNRYSSDGATKLAARGKTASLSSAILHGIWAFLRTYFLRLGFLDGRIGFILAVSNAETTYYRYLKLMLLTEQKPTTSPENNA